MAAMCVMDEWIVMLFRFALMFVRSNLNGYHVVLTQTFAWLMDLCR